MRYAAETPGQMESMSNNNWCRGDGFTALLADWRMDTHHTHFKNSEEEKYKPGFWGRLVQKPRTNIINNFGGRFEINYCQNGRESIRDAYIEISKTIFMLPVWFRVLIPTRRRAGQRSDRASYSRIRTLEESTSPPICRVARALGGWAAGPGMGKSCAVPCRKPHGPDNNSHCEILFP